MLQRSGPGIDSSGKNGKADKCDKMVILVNQGNGKPGRARGILKMLEQAWPQSDTIGKIVKPSNSLKWHNW